MLLVPFEFVERVDECFDVERNGHSEPALESSREMDGTLHVMIEPFVDAALEQCLFNSVNHLSGDWNPCLSACAGSQEKDDVFGSAGHINSQEPGPDVLDSWHREPS